VTASTSEPPPYATSEHTPGIPEAEADRWFHPGALSALARTGGSAFVGIVVPLTQYGSLATTWTHVLLSCGGTSGAIAGGHTVACTVALVGVGATWLLDPGANPKGRHGIATAALVARRYTARTLRWAIVAGSVFCLPVLIGFIHITAGVH
jgi:hypothetical protein